MPSRLAEIDERGYRMPDVDRAREGGAGRVSPCRSRAPAAVKIFVHGGDHGRVPGELQDMVAKPIPRLNLVFKPQRLGRGTDTARADGWDALMAAAQSGHGGAYQRLLTELSGWLNAYFRRRLPVGDVDDAVQETLLAVHRRRHTYDPKLPFAPWLAAIAKRKWIDQLRSLGRRASEELPGDLPVADHEAAVTSASVLAGVLNGLRPAQAQAITLVKLQGYTIDEASRETGLSVSAVKMNIHRGLARVTAILEKTDDID